MKQLSKVLASVLGLVSLVVLAVVLTFVFSSLRDKKAPATSRSPLQSPTPVPSATAIPTDKIVPSLTVIPEDKTFESPLPTPTMTNPPKPTEAPIPTPTVTPVPTKLPLPESAFYALWAENFSGRQGENCCKGSVLWLADPGDVASRREVLRFEQDIILEVVLSPNGQKMALVTSVWPWYSVWIANADGTDAQQVDIGSNVVHVGDLSWSRDSHSLAYGLRWDTEVLTPSAKTGTPMPIRTTRGGIELLDTRTGKIQRILDVGPNTSLSVLGWSASGQELYYRRADQEYGVWAVRLETTATRVLFLLSVDQIPVLSPAGDKFVMGDSAGVIWRSVDGQDEYVITSQPEPGFSVVWAPGGREIVSTHRETGSSHVTVRATNVQTRSSQNVGTVDLTGNWRLVSVSADYSWLTIDRGDRGLYWIHPSSGTVVPVPKHGLWRLFVDWVSSVRASE